MQTCVNIYNNHCSDKPGFLVVEGCKKWYFTEHTTEKVCSEMLDCMMPIKKWICHTGESGFECINCLSGDFLNKLESKGFHDDAYLSATYRHMKGHRIFLLILTVLFLFYNIGLLIYGTMKARTTVSIKFVSILNLGVGLLYIMDVIIAFNI